MLNPRKNRKSGLSDQYIDFGRLFGSYIRTIVEDSNDKVPNSKRVHLIRYLYSFAVGSDIHGIKRAAEKRESIR